MKHVRERVRGREGGRERERHREREGETQRERGRERERWVPVVVLENMIKESNNEDDYWYTCFSVR